MPEGTALTHHESDWDRVMHVNLKGIFLLSRAAVPRMIERGGDCIIITASRYCGTLGSHRGRERGGRSGADPCRADKAQPFHGRRPQPHAPRKRFPEADQPLVRVDPEPEHVRELVQPQRLDLRDLHDAPPATSTVSRHPAYGSAEERGTRDAVPPAAASLRADQHAVLFAGAKLAATPRTSPRAPSPRRCCSRRPPPSPCRSRTAGTRLRAACGSARRLPTPGRTGSGRLTTAPLRL